MLTSAPRADVIAAIATPPGRGGIGVVRVSGPDLARVVDGIVGRALTAREATLTNFHGAHGEVLDQGLGLGIGQHATHLLLERVSHAQAMKPRQGE